MIEKYEYTFGGFEFANVAGDAKCVSALFDEANKVIEEFPYKVSQSESHLTCMHYVLPQEIDAIKVGVVYSRPLGTQSDPSKTLNYHQLEIIIVPDIHGDKPGELFGCPILTSKVCPDNTVMLCSKEELAKAIAIELQKLGIK